MEEEKVVVKWYQKKWFVILMTVAMWPIGLVLMWISPDFKPKTKKIVSGIFLALLVLAAVTKSGDKSKDNDYEGQSVKQEVKKEEPKKVEKKVEKKVTEARKVDKAEYYIKGQRLLKNYYKNLAQSLGQGVPDVDTRFTTYACWSPDDSMVVTKGTYYLAGNENVEHEYVIRWRRKTQEVIHVQINGKKVYYNEKMQDAAFNDADELKKS